MAGCNYYYYTYYFVSRYPFDLSDLHLHSLVKSPVKIELGGRGILKVNRSEEGDLVWFHYGRLINVNLDSHFTLVDTQSSTVIELEISNATAKHGGSYQVLLMTEFCIVRDFIFVELQGK